MSSTRGDIGSIDHITFWRDHVRVPLTDVPPLAFSEAMRHVDLFV